MLWMTPDLLTPKSKKLSQSIRWPCDSCSLLAILGSPYSEAGPQLKPTQGQYLPQILPGCRLRKALGHGSIYLSLICGGPTMGGTVLSVRDAKVSITSGLGSAGRTGTQATEGAVWKEGDSTCSSVVEAPWGLAWGTDGCAPSSQWHKAGFLEEAASRLRAELQEGASPSRMGRNVEWGWGNSVCYIPARGLRTHTRGCKVPGRWKALD